MWLKSWKTWSLVSAVALCATLVAVASVYAALVTSISDTLSTQEASTDANHVLSFTTPSGVAEGEEIIITFPSAFDTSSIIEDDVDIADDGVDLTTTETNCIGADQASVSMIADQLTIGICVGDGGAIAAGSVITIEIGNNATASGTGANQITNPTLGTYFVSIAGSFGDTGTIAIPIISDGSVGVSGTVSGGGGGAPGPTGCVDTTPPVISSVLASSITGSSATISWTTDELTTDTVNYGLTSSYGSTTSSGTFSTSHSVSLSGLSQSTTYHYQIVAADGCPNTTTSADYTFTTLDTTAPVITNVQVTNITTSTARVTWTTNEVATSQVDYGTTALYGLITSDSSYETSHLVSLSGLSEGTTYHLKVTSVDASLNSASSSDYSFATLTDTAPANVSSFTATAGDARVLLSWINPTDSDLAGVKIIACTNETPSGHTDSDCVQIYNSTGTSYTHTGLTNGTTYYYGAFAYDVGGHYASGALASATPRAAEEEEEEEEETPPEEEDGDEEPPSEDETPDSETTDVCGDRVCGSSESSFICPTDCTVPTTSVCGNDVCESDETASSCPTDCAGRVICGDAVCGEGETSEACPSDCPVAEIPETTVSEEELIPSSDVSIVANGSTLTIGADGIFSAVAGSVVLVVLSDEHITKEVESTFLSFGSETYLLSYSNGAYSAEVTVPGTSTRYAFFVVIQYADKTSQTISLIANLIGSGLVYELVDETSSPVSGATVTLYSLQGGNWVVWDGSPSGQFNPTTTTSNGNFFWYVANGSYKVAVSKSGYQDKDSGSILITNNIVNPRIEIQKIEEEIPVTIETMTENIGLVAKTITEAVEAVAKTIETIRLSPVAQTTAAAAAPVVAVAAITTTAVLATSFDLFSFLQLLYTSPLLLFGRRKRKAYGVVYNSLLKKPIDLAMVRLVKMPENKIVGARVTDKDGRFFFLVQPGTYRLEITKQAFDYPSKLLKDIKDDAFFLDIYHGEIIEVTEKNVTITPNVPLDPISLSKLQTPKEIKIQRTLRLVQNYVSLIGIVVAASVLVVHTTIWSITLLGFQILVYLLVRRLAAPHKPKSWGIVYDKATNRPLSNVVVRIFEPKYQKLLESAVTDSKGRYTFLLGPNEYHSTYEKDGYDSQEIQINYTSEKDVKELAKDVELESKL